MSSCCRGVPPAQWGKHSAHNHWLRIVVTPYLLRTVDILSCTNQVVRRNLVGRGPLKCVPSTSSSTVSAATQFNCIERRQLTHYDVLIPAHCHQHIPQCRCRPPIQGNTHRLGPTPLLRCARINALILHDDDLANPLSWTRG